MKTVFTFVIAIFMVLFVLVTFTLAWVTGSYIQIKVGDKVVGHLRWFTYKKI